MRPNRTYSPLPPMISAGDIFCADPCGPREPDPCPHTCGVRVCSCAAFATEPCRPTAYIPAAPFRHTPYRFRPRRTATVWRNLQQHPRTPSSYTFSAKEKDSETGLSYFGARYYSSDLSIWLSVDPMSDKYPYQSGYVYCGNNPIKVIDPNGEDEWDLTRDGTLTKRENGRTDIDIVHATTSEGNATSRKFPANSIDQKKDSYTFKQEVFDDNGKSYMKSCTTNYMQFTDLDVGYSFFEFAAENTSVEWAISSSDKEVRVGTAGEELFVRMPGVTNEKESYHSHDLKHTGKEFISQADRDAAKYYINKNVTTGVYMAGERQYYMFEKQSYPNDTFYDYFGNKKPARSKNN